MGQDWAEKHLVKAWLQSPIKYQILYAKVEPFIINLSTSKLVEKILSILLHSFAKQQRSLHLNDKSETRTRLSDLQPQISTLMNNKWPQSSHY